MAAAAAAVVVLYLLPAGCRAVFWLQIPDHDIDHSVEV